MRGTFAIITLIFAAPFALAQDEEPTVNDTDYDTTPPEDDQSYLDDAQLESDTMEDGEFDTSLPADDTSYLDEAASEMDSEDTTPAARADTPGPGALVVLALVGVLALARARR